MKEILLSLIRKKLIILGTYLVTKGWADDTTWQLVLGGALALWSILWGVGSAWVKSHLLKVTQPLQSPRASGNGIPLMLLAGCAAVFLATGCQTALNSNKLISVKQRCFGVVVETTSTTANAPNVKLGFCSTVWQMIPTSTNAPIYAPAYMDTFELTQGLNPFDTSISENTGAGSVMIGTNGEASAFAPWPPK